MVSVALGAAGRVLPVFKKNRTVMINLFVLGLAGILTSALFKQPLLASLSLVIAMHQLYTLELYQRYARMRKLERYVVRKKTDRCFGVKGWRKQECMTNEAPYAASS